MLLSVGQLSRYFDVRPAGVLHVGAHAAEEAGDYATHGWQPVIWVDMLPENCEALRRRFAGDPRNIVLQAACWDADGEQLPVFRGSNSQASSLLEPQDHVTLYPGITFSQDAGMATSRLDSILPADSKFDYLSLDIQGAELRALRGLGRHLAGIKWACIEVNTRHLYSGGALMSELDAFMHEAGFLRLLTRMAGTKGWGDALYISTRLLQHAQVRRLQRRAALWSAYTSVVDFPRLLRPRALARRFRGAA